jgi:hypothetical protein
MGVPVVTDVLLTGPLFPSREAALRAAAAVTQETAHPYSRAIIRACDGYVSARLHFGCRIVLGWFGRTCPAAEPFGQAGQHREKEVKCLIVSATVAHRNVDAVDRAKEFGAEVGGGAYGEVAEYGEAVSVGKSNRARGQVTKMQSLCQRNLPCGERN